MTALYIIGGIILFFVVIFSVRVHVSIDYADTTVVKLHWLFLNIPLVDPSKPKKPKKKKDKKKKDEEKGEDEEAKPDEKKKKEKQPGNSFIKQLYIDQGYDGIEKMLLDIKEALGGFFGKVFKTFTFDELYIKMKVVGGDAADTAIKYGKLCGWLYPTLGKLVSTCKVKKYDFDITPDFLANKKEASLYAKFYIVPIRITNAVVVLAFELLFKVLLKLLFTNQKSKKSKQAATPTKEGKPVASAEQKSK